tara:strand:+ start:157 stop:1215 length:1059 start_codon:yes stop_codon:yes gene_type:complete
MNIFVTGGCGFIGSNFIRYWLSTFPDSFIVNLDKLTYAGNKNNLLDIEEYKNYQFIQGDILDNDLLEIILKKYHPSFVVNFAAETHVDRSIIYPEEFINTNILGTFRLLSSLNKYYSKMNNREKAKFRFLHISTDEVYGSLSIDQDPFKETNKYFPNSPYSASKASSDHIVRSFYKTYNLPILISNCSNNYGPYQSLEKFIPLVIHNALMKKEIPIYGDGMNVRDWLYVNDHCDAIKKIILNGDPGEVYNIGCSNEITNIDIAKTICTLLDSFVPLNGKKSYLDFIKFIKDRPGHDFRYAIDSSKIKKKLSWHAKTSFKDGISTTTKWYLENMFWFKENAGKDFDKWIDLQY